MVAEVGFPAPDVFEAELTRMVDLKLASRIAARDADVWGPDAAELAAKRLGWTDLHTRAAGLIEQIHALRDELAAEGIDRIVLAGMGGSSLGAEVIARTYGAELVVIDSTDPLDIAALRDGDDIVRSAMVVATKSGTTVETVSAASAFAQGLLARGIDPRTRLIAVTDPDTPMAEQALEEGWRRLFLADPRVGGRFSALAAFGLVPAGLAGADVQQVVDDAAAVAESVRSDDEENPALRLGAALTAAHARGVRSLALAATDDSLEGLPAWLEQLIAESSGKDGAGILPIACGSVEAPGFHDAHAATALGFLGPAVGSRQPISGVAVSLEAPLGAQLLVWQTAVALLCAGIGVNPFDQPDVEDAKVRARAMLAPDAEQSEEDEAHPESHESDTGDADSADTSTADAEPDTAEAARTYSYASSFTDGPVDVQTTSDAPGSSVEEVIAGLFPAVSDEDSYLAVQVYLSAHHDAQASALRDLLARKSGGTVAFGWGPRYLHSTGQFHKGGRPTGSFVFIGSEAGSVPDAEVPEAGYGFAALQSAQADGDAQVLMDRGRPVVKLSLKDRGAGIAYLLEALETLPDPEPRVAVESEADGSSDSSADAGVDTDHGDDVEMVPDDDGSNDKAEGRESLGDESVSGESEDTVVEEEDSETTGPEADESDDPLSTDETPEFLRTDDESSATDEPSGAEDDSSGDAPR